MQAVSETSETDYSKVITLLMHPTKNHSCMLNNDGYHSDQVPCYKLAYKRQYQLQTEVHAEII